MTSTGEGNQPGRLRIHTRGGREGRALSWPGKTQDFSSPLPCFCCKRGNLWSRVCPTQGCSQVPVRFCSSEVFKSDHTQSPEGFPQWKVRLRSSLPLVVPALSQTPGAVSSEDFGVASPYQERVEEMESGFAQAGLCGSIPTPDIHVNRLGRA